MAIGKHFALFAGPALAAAGYVLAAQAGLDGAMAWTIAITTLTAVWWITEALPIPATSLVPFALFPLAGVIDHREAASALGSHVIVLLMGAFMLSKSLEKSGVHERLALKMINLVGGSGGGRLVLAFMLTAMLLSMWISNTATVLMLTPMALAILSRSDDPRLAVPLLLGVAYASSVGGVGTLIGTPPNVIFAGIYQQFTGEDFGFLRWMTTGAPIAVLAIPVMALWLSRNLRGAQPIELPRAGAWRQEEKRVLMVFGLAIVLWVTRSEPFGGWSALLGMEQAGDSTVALFAVVLMFLTPNGSGGRLLDWKTANDIPWGMLLLFAGGIVIAKAFTASGLSVLIGEQLAGLSTLAPFAMLLALALSVSFLTEITSNTATATLLMPVLASAAVGAGVAPELFMAPAAISASCAFMLPVATAPNAIIYSTGRISIRRMAGEGVVLNILVALVVAAVSYLTLR